MISKAGLHLINVCSREKIVRKAANLYYVTRHFHAAHANSQEHISYIKELRKITKGGVAACKEALIKSNWDIDEAIAYIRQKQQSSYNDIDSVKLIYGKIAVPTDVSICNISVIVELNCNCDFITSSKEFAQLSHTIRNAIQLHVDKGAYEGIQSSPAGLKALSIDTCKDITLDEKEQITIGEKLKIVSGEYKRAIAISHVLVLNNASKSCYRGVYVHKRVDTKDGTVGDRVAVASIKCEPSGKVTGEALDKKVMEFAKSIAVQLAANPPLHRDKETTQSGGENETLMQSFLDQCWLQPDQIVSKLNSISEILGVAKPDIMSNLTVRHTLDILANILDVDEVTITDAVYMKSGENMLILHQN